MLETSSRGGVPGMNVYSSHVQQCGGKDQEPDYYTTSSDLISVGDREYGSILGSGTMAKRTFSLFYKVKELALQLVTDS